MAISSEERILISKATRRDSEAFSTLYVQFYEPVLRRVNTIVRDRQDAEDITSEAFLRAWNAIDRFTDRDVSILAWFATIAERIAIKHVKRRRPSVDVDDVVLGDSPDSHPENLLIREADMASLQSAINELPSLQREIVEKKFLKDLTYQELGLALGRPVGTVRVMQHRALKALKGILLAQSDQIKPRPVLRSRRPDA